MESELSPDKQKDIPPVPIKTYQWEDVRRSREAGGYPWTHLLKVPLEGEITAEDIIRETTPRRSMSREVSRSRTRSPDGEMQKILNLDASPGSSRKHGEEGEDEGVHIPNFSKEVSLESDEDAFATNIPSTKAADNQSASHLATPIEIPKSVSPKGILKRRVPEQQYNIGVTETREKTKCCHPLVNKIKHLAEQTLHKLERNENEKSPVPKRKKDEESQEIRQLRSSPGAVRRQKFSAIKLGDSDEMSKTMSMETPPPRKSREHIYEDIEEKVQDAERTLHFSSDTDKHREDDENKSNSNRENDSLTNIEKKSIASQDPSLVTEEFPLKSEEHVMEKLHKMDHINKEAVLLDEEMDPEEPDVDEIFQTQLDERTPNNESPNITITEITDDEGDVSGEPPNATPIETSPSPSPLDIAKRKEAEELAEREWSKPSSDHEYEIIEKPPPNIIYTAPSVDAKPTMVKTDDELSSTTSLERKYLQHTSDEEDPVDDKETLHDNEGILNAETLQRNIEDRFFVNTPSTVSRTECEVSTSQVDSSALEQLPLKRDSRTKNAETTDSKIQQRIKEGTGKLKTQAGKLKTKLQNIKTTKFSMPDRPKINFPERPKFKMPERPKITAPKFTMPDRRKFSLPDRPKFKKINISEKLNLGDRKKFTLPERPKFNVPEMPKFKMPERPKINFPSLGRKKEHRVETEATGSTTELSNVATVDFEARTYPRWFSKKKKENIPKTSSSPTLNREDTPPPTFTFTRVKKTTVTEKSSPMKLSSSEPTKQHNILEDENVSEEAADMEAGTQFEATYDFDKLDTEYMDEDPVAANENHQNETYPSELSPSKQDHTPVITEISNDEFFVRPRGISREDIQVREYLRDETRQAFRTPKNVLALMGSSSEVNDDNLYLNDPEEEDPELINDNEPIRYSTEDLNDKDDGYYTFPPVRPSRAKRKKKPVQEIEQPRTYINESIDPNMHFTEVDLGLLDIHDLHMQEDIMHIDSEEMINGESQIHFTPAIHSIHEYANDDVIQYPENDIIQSQTLPMPPKRNKKFSKKDLRHSSLSDFKKMPVEELWEESCRQSHADDIVVYRTEHEYIVPGAYNSTVTATAPVPAQSPVPPRRTRSRSSRGTSLCDDDRTSHGAESLTLDTHLPHTEPIDLEREIRHESPGYATVDKGPNVPSKSARRSVSKTPPVRRRKSSSSERKYYTVGGKSNMPDRPPRKKSSTSLMTLDSYTKHSDGTQYVEIDDEPFEEVQKYLKSGDVVNKMKDRPLPPPPRPPRGSKKKKDKSDGNDSITPQTEVPLEVSKGYPQEPSKADGVVEIEVSTQTDPLPDDMDFELGYDDNLDMSITSSLRDIVDDDSILAKSHSRLGESPRVSRPTSRSERSVKLSDPKISELSKPNIGRTSPTVILVEKRVSSPTRINEHEVMVTEASLTVQHIDIDESKIPDVPPLPMPRRVSNAVQSTKNSALPPPNEERALERMTDATREIQLDNLVTQRLQVRDLDVGRLNVSELQANKILVSDIEGMTLQVAELDSKSGHISVSGIEFSQSVIDEIVKKFAEVSTISQPPATSQSNVDVPECPTPVSRVEETQLEQGATEEAKNVSSVATAPSSPTPPPRPEPPVTEEAPAPQRPPPPDLTPLLYSYLQDIAIPPAQFFPPRSMRERQFNEFYEHGNGPPAPSAPARRSKRRPAAPHSESSSDEGKVRPSPRRGPLARTHEPTIAEAGAQFLRVCHNSISRTLRHMFNSLMLYISGAEDKKDAQMALVIFLVLVAGLIMFGLSDSRTVHHHHWEFFNPPDGKQ